MSLESLSAEEMNFELLRRAMKKTNAAITTTMEGVANLEARLGQQKEVLAFLQKKRAGQDSEFAFAYSRLFAKRAGLEEPTTKNAEKAEAAAVAGEKETET